MQIIKLHPAYLAGVLDSDGSLSIVIRHKNRPTPNFTACFSLTWTLTKKCERVMKILKKQYGGSIHIQKRNKNSFKNNKPTLKYFIVSRQLKPFVLDILPYVQLKKEQCKTILKLLNSSYFGQYGHGRPKPKKLQNFHYNLYLKNKSLNTKNSGDRRTYGNN